MGQTAKRASVLFGVVFVACGNSDVPCEGEACMETPVCTGEDCPGRVVWSHSLPINVHGSPAIHPGTGQVVISSGVAEGNVVRPQLDAFSPDGEELWHEDLDRGFLSWPSRPVFVGDEMYVAINDLLFKFGLDGQDVYRALAPEGSKTGVNYAYVAPPPAIGLAGRVYWQFLAASNPDGSLAWRTFVDPDTRCETPVAVREDRVLMREGNKITAYDEIGHVIWSLDSPNNLVTDPGCQMVPVTDDIVATLWCERGFSSFVCGHVVTIDLKTGVALQITAPPKPVAETSTLLVEEDGSMLIFSVGPTGNPDYKSRMWRVAVGGGVIGDVITLPWFGVYGASLGNDGLVYLATNRGAAAITKSGEIEWAYERSDTVGFHSGAPALGANGCVYYESVRQYGRDEYDRELMCLKGNATGLADTRWPRTFGGNESALRPPQ